MGSCHCNQSFCNFQLLVILQPVSFVINPAGLVCILVANYNINKVHAAKFVAMTIFCLRGISDLACPIEEITSKVCHGNVVLSCSEPVPLCLQTLSLFLVFQFISSDHVHPITQNSEHITFKQNFVATVYKPCVLDETKKENIH